MPFDDKLLPTKIATLKREFEEHEQRQDARLDHMKTVFLEEVKIHLYESLKEVASAIVKQIVSREVTKRVRAQVSREITQRRNTLHPPDATISRASIADTPIHPR